ncbi:MAG: GNAT family N-acetyltransferase [Pseudomonadota bacterium]
MAKVERLGVERSAEMADLHAACFAAQETWSSGAFSDVLSLPTTYARGIFEADRLRAFALIQFVAGDAEILTLATAPEARQRGLAREILQSLQEELAPLGLEKWLLEVAADNSGAITFYQRLGFQTDGERRNYYKRLEGGAVNAILMSKPAGRQAPD